MKKLYIPFFSACALLAVSCGNNFEKNIDSASQKVEELKSVYVSAAGGDEDAKQKYENYLKELEEIGTKIEPQIEQLEEIQNNIRFIKKSYDTEKAAIDALNSSYNPQLLSAYEDLEVAFGSAYYTLISYDNANETIDSTTIEMTAKKFIKLGTQLSEKLHKETDLNKEELERLERTDSEFKEYIEEWTSK